MRLQPHYDEVCTVCNRLQQGGAGGVVKSKSKSSSWFSLIKATGLKGFGSFLPGCLFYDPGEANVRDV